MRKKKSESHQDIANKESKNKNSDNLENDFNQELVILRNKIDKIDKKILQLLQERMLIVKDVKLLKEKYHNNFFIKSAREADMIRNLIAKMQLNHCQLELPLLPVDCIIDIWRKIISSANFIEQKLNIAIFKDNDQSSYKLLTYQYYHHNFNYYDFIDSNEFLSNIAKRAMNIGIISLPQDDFTKLDSIALSIKLSEISQQSAIENKPIWLEMALKYQEIKVFTPINFTNYNQDLQNNKNQYNLLAIANKEQEKSYKDKTLLILKTCGNIPQISNFIAIIKDIDGKIAINDLYFDNKKDGECFILIEYDDFIENKNIKESKIFKFANDFFENKDSNKIAIFNIGSYPDRINLNIESKTSNYYSLAL